MTSRSAEINDRKRNTDEQNACQPISIAKPAEYTRSIGYPTGNRPRIKQRKAKQWCGAIVDAFLLQSNCASARYALATDQAAVDRPEYIGSTYED
jgi:hypothetical protein